MKKEIYTADIIEAFEENCDCPFCKLYNDLEKDSLKFILGSAYMTDTIRLETNKTGFCKHHCKEMLKDNNVLGIALMLQTHLKYINDNFNFSEPNKIEHKPLFSKKALNNDFLNNITNSCYICNRISKIFNFYIETFFYMLDKKKDFKNYVINSKGFCLEHFNILTNYAYKNLSQNKFNEFYDIIYHIEAKKLKSIETDLEKFVDSFDYSNKEKLTNNVKNSIPQAMMILSGLFYERKE